MTDKIMKTNRITRILAGFCLLGAVACAKEVTEESYGGGEVVVGIDDNIQMYPLGGSLIIPSYYPERLYISYGYESTWIREVPESVMPGESFTISAGETDSERSATLEFSRNRDSDVVETIRIYQSAPEFGFEPLPDQLAALGGEVDIYCESNINYSIYIETDAEDFTLKDDKYEFSSADDRLNLSYPMGAHNKQRTVRLIANAMDFRGERDIRAIDTLDIIQQPYDLYFDVNADSENVKPEYYEMEIAADGNVAQYVYIYSSGPWYPKFEFGDEDWAGVTVNGIAVSYDPEDPEILLPGVNEIGVKADRNTGDSRYFTMYICNEENTYEIVLNVTQAENK